ncbi:MAG: MotA/TolQ/ExbB proton channel family protein [Chlamydiota bacterium]
MNSFSNAFAQSDIFGKLIFLGLLILSLMCWVTLLYKIWLIQQVKKQSHYLLAYFEKNKDSFLHLSLDNLSIKIMKEVPRPFISIFSILKTKTLEVLEKNHYFITHSLPQNPEQNVYLSRADIELIETHLSMTMLKQKELLEKYLFLLPTITTLAPFVGLLGTVWGILLMFTGLQSGGSLSSNSAVLGGLSTALVTTVLGLLIAIPSLVAYNYLKQAIKSYSSQMQNFGHMLLSTIELQYRKVDTL